MREIFRRSSANPIISHQDLPFQAAAVYNPGATEQNGETVLLLRVEDDAGYSSISMSLEARTASPTGISILSPF